MIYKPTKIPNQIITFTVTSIVFLLMIFLFKLSAIDKLWHTNNAQVDLLNLLMSDNICAVNRQAYLKQFVDISRNLCTECSSIKLVDDVAKYSMLESVFVGEYYRFRGDLNQALEWYSLAAQAEPEPATQRSLAYAPRMNLQSDGSILIENFADTENWELDQVNSNVPDVIFESQDGVGVIAYQNRFEQRDIVAFSLYPEGGVELGYHTSLFVRTKLDPGTFLTLEVKVDDTLERYLNYYQGTGEWETLRIPLDGQLFQFIKIGVSEPSLFRDVNSYKAEIDTIKIELVPLDNQVY